jgi:putative ABC transport system permease protein
MIKNYLTIALRNLFRNKVYSFINLTGLALGLACTLLIALWVQSELAVDKFHANGPRLYTVMSNLYWDGISTSGIAPASLNEAMKKDFPEIESVATFAYTGPLLFSYNGLSFKETGNYCSPDLLTMFSFPLVKGDPKTALSAPDRIVITESLARKYFGTADPIGKTIKVDNKSLFTVSGVLKDLTDASSLKFNWLIPFETHLKNNPWLAKWGSFSVNMFVMLKPNVSMDATNVKLKNFLTKASGKDTKDEIFLQPYGDGYLYGHFRNGKQDGGRIEYVKLFTLVASFVLLIACINFMNLTTARSSKRSKEVGIRKVVGAERKTIIMQFMGEATLLTLFSVALSLVLVWVSLPYFNQLTSKHLSINFGDPSFVFMLVGVTLITIFISGSYPALFLSALKPVSILKTSIIKNTGTALLRKSLVVLQFTLSIFLIISTMIIYQQVQYLKNQNLGIDKNNLISVPLNEDIMKHKDILLQQLSGSNVIKSVSLVMDLPIDINGTSGDLNWEGKKPGTLGSISATYVGYNYLNTIGVPLVEGRDFDKNRADSTNYIINETAAKMMGIKNPIGKTVNFWNGKGQIIGVAKDFHLNSLHSQIPPLILVLQPINTSIILIRTAPGKTAEALAGIKKVYNSYNSLFPFEYHFMDEVYEQRYKSEIVIGQLGNIFSAITIFISCLGLFGLAAFTAEQRIKEIGIRKVVGASVFNITLLLSRDFLKLVFFSMLIAMPVAFWISNKWLQSFAFRIDMPWWVFIVAGIMAMLIAFGTVSFQSIKAALSNPVKNLRTE